MAHTSPATPPTGPALDLDLLRAYDLEAAEAARASADATQAVGAITGPVQAQLLRLIASAERVYPMSKSA
ncbi:MAG: hypothetical protein AB7J40_04060 [Candidatus Altimarinota bacterium]